MFHQQKIEKEWRKEDLPPFDELIFSWNAKRPSLGRYLFYLSVKIEEWSPWLLYATWGSEGQASFHQTAENMPVRVFQDALEVLAGQRATGFQVKIDVEGGARLEEIYHLHVYTNSEKDLPYQHASPYAPSVHLPVSGLSQMILPHLRHADLCSPTATTAVIRFLSEKEALDPLHFAQNVWDRGFDLFGNWVFNVAQAVHELGKGWSGWVERLKSFAEIVQKLQQGIPVVISVRGPLSGSALPYAKGHLLAVIGYDSLHRKVLCMDPAFPTDQTTSVFYEEVALIKAWERRGHIAYIFHRK